MLIGQAIQQLFAPGHLPAPYPRPLLSSFPPHPPSIVTGVSFIETLDRPAGSASASARDASAAPEAPPDGQAPSALESLSPSRASSFKQCPRLFRYRSIERLPEPVTVHQARGTTAHLALERLFDLPARRRTADRLYDLFREVWTELRREPDYSELFGSREEERDWGLESLGVIANYLALEDPVSAAPLHRELEMAENLGEISVRGILDRLDARPDGRLVIIDYKTGAAPPERYALPAFFALKIYALLVRRRFEQAPAELRLLYLGSSTVYSIPVDDRMLDGIERQVTALAKTISKAIEQDHFPPRPSALCGWCSFRSICPAFEETPAGNGAAGAYG